MQNCQMVDHLNPFKKEFAKISGKRKKSDEDHAALAAIEYEAGLYLNAAGEPIIPSRMVEATLLAAAKVHKEGKICAAALFVDHDTVITYDGGPLSVLELKASPEHKLVTPVVVQRSRLMRTRPLFKQVKASIMCSLNDLHADQSQLHRWWETALSTVGFGDYRPRYGRGRLLAFGSVGRT